MFANIKNEAVALLGPGAKTDTAAATGSWVLVSNYEGSFIVTQNAGTVTAGSLAGKLRTATDDSGSGAADITGATFVTVTTSNDPKCEAINVQCNACGPYIQYVGTVGTGPVDLSVSLIGCPKY